MLKVMQLGAKISVNIGNAKQSFGKVGEAVARMGKHLDKAKVKLDKVKSAVQGMTGVSTVFAAAFGFGAMKAANFEQQMSAVQAVLLASKSDMTDLNNLAQTLGSTTNFSATEAAQGMEFFARAGFTTKEIMEGIPAVLNAAAAEGMDLATASSIVSDVVKGLGLEAKDAAQVADTLALASARTNTNIVGLGEGLKYAASTAKTVGVPMHETVAAVAALQDMGLKGTMAGTSLSIMMTKMAAPGAKAQKAMENLGLSFKDANGDMLSLKDQLIVLQRGFQSAGGSADKLALAQTLFGARGQKAALNLVARFSDTKKPLEELFEQLENADGSARKMADIRLDNLKGQFTLLMSALEGVAIAGFGGINEAGSSVIKTVTEFFSKMAAGMRGDDSVGGFAADFGRGIMLIVGGIRNLVNMVVPFFKKLKDMFENAFGAGSAGKLGAFTALLSVIVAVITPIAVLAGGIAAVVTFLGEALVPVLAGFGVLAALIGGGVGAATSGVGESFSTLFMNIQGFIGGVLGFFGGLYNGIFDNVDIIMNNLAPAFASVGEVINVLFSLLGDLFGTSTGGAVGFGKTLGMIVVVLIDIIALVIRLVAFIIELFVGAIGAALRPFTYALGDILGVFSNIINGGMTLKEAFIHLFSGLGHIMTAPFKSAINIILSLVKGLMDSAFVKEALSLVGLEIDSSSIANAIDAVDNFGKRDGGSASQEEFANEAQKALKEKSRAQVAATTTDVKVENVIEDNRKLCIQNQLSMNGKGVALANSEQEIELTERAGFSNSSWQKRQVLERGVKVMP